MKIGNVQGRLGATGRWLALFALIVAAVGAYCLMRPASDFCVSLGRLVMLRELVGDDSVKLRLTAVALFPDQEDIATVMQVAAGSGYVLTLDGEQLPVRNQYYRFVEPAQDSRYPGIHQDVLDQWMEMGYVPASPGARRLYAKALTGERCMPVGGVAREVVIIEHNRLIRCLLDGWRSWAHLREMALWLQCLAGCAGTFDGREEVLASIGGIVETANWVCDEVGDGVKPNSKLDHVVRSLCQATDGRLSRRRLLPVVGLYDAGAYLDQLDRRDLAKLSAYWDDARLTRYVINQSEIWRVITIGEWVRVYADGKSGCGGDLKEFMMWTNG